MSHTIDSFYSPDDPNNNVRTFEELCRAHIQAFARGADKYAAETKLSQRVNHWQDRLAPLLEAEEQRPVFDIHAYGQQVIDKMEQEIQRMKTKPKNAAEDDDDDDDDSMDETTTAVDFREVTRHCPQFEVCRMFLASLSLCNSGNVGLGGTNVKGTSLQIDLLSGDIERPMETYLAPSAAEEVGAAG